MYYDIRHTIYDIRHTTYGVRHTTYDIRHTTYDIRHTVYDIGTLVYNLVPNHFSLEHSLARQDSNEFKVMSLPYYIPFSNISHSVAPSREMKGQIDHQIDHDTPRVEISHRSSNRWLIYIRGVSWPI